LHPAALTRDVAAVELLGDDALQAAIYDHVEQCGAVLEAVADNGDAGGKVELFEKLAPLRIRERQHRLVADREQVEDHESELDRLLAVQQPRAHVREPGDLVVKTSSPSYTPSGSCRSSGTSPVVSQPRRERTR